MNSKVSMALRVILGLVFLVFGANKFGNFMPMPEMSDAAQNFMGALAGAGYFKILGVLEILIGLLLVLNKYVGFALVTSAALATNFLIFHVAHDIGGIWPAALVSVLTVILLYANWGKLKTLF